MKSSKTLLLTCACAAVLAASAAGPAFAQRAAQQEFEDRELARQQLIERERAAEQQQAAERRVEQERLRASQAELGEAQAELAGRQRDIDQARRELERSRREMEAAARKIAELSQAQSFVQFGSLPEAYSRALRGRARAYIGATINDTDAGARVMSVTPGSPAAEAGIRTGDVIVAVNGADVTASEQGAQAAVIEALGQIDPGAIASIEVLRDGERQVFEVETSDSSPFYFFRGQNGNANGNNFTWRGWSELANLPGLFATRWRDMELVELSPGLGEYFGTDEGLLVVHAPASDDIGLRDGDVILEIGGRTPNSPEHAMRILTSFAPGETLELAIMRQRRRETLEYEIPRPGD